MTLTINQVVAFNLMRARRRKGWTQEETASHLTRVMGRRWSKASLGAAERSWEGGRVRQFDTNELLAFCHAFGHPLAYFFIPPDTDSNPDKFALGADAPEVLSAAAILRYALAMDRSHDYSDAVQAALHRAGLPVRRSSDAIPQGGIGLDEDARREVLARLDEVRGFLLGEDELA